MSCNLKTYGAAFSALAPGTDPTFAIVELDGSATKIIRLLRIGVTGTKLTAVAVESLRLTKLSSISTGGTSTSATNVPFDSAFPAATAVFKGFTVAPTGGGVVVGAIAADKLLLDVITTLMVMQSVVYDFSTLPFQARPTLRTAAQAFALDFNGVDPAHAESLSCYAWWTESTI